MRERTAVKIARFVPGRGGMSNPSSLFNLGKPFVVLHEVGTSREEPIPQVAEEMAKS